MGGRADLFARLDLVGGAGVGVGNLRNWIWNDLASRAVRTYDPVVLKPSENHKWMGFRGQKR